MPLTSQIIENIVEKQIEKQLAPLKEEISVMHKKLDRSLQNIEVKVFGTIRS